MVGFDDAAGGGQGGQSLVEAGGADTAEPTQFGERKRAGGIGECCCDALVDGAGRRCLRCMPFDHLKRQRIGALREFKRDGRHGGSRAVLSRESEIITITAQIEIGIAPGVELGGAAQGLAGPNAAGTLLGVVDDDHGDAVSSLQLAQIGEQRRDLAAGILIDAMQTHEGIENEQARLQFGDGVVERPAVGFEIEPHGRSGDHLYVEIGERDACGGADAVWPKK